MPVVYKALFIFIEISKKLNVSELVNCFLPILLLLLLYVSLYPNDQYRSRRFCVKFTIV